MRHPISILVLPTTLLAVGLLGGCASAPPVNAQLEQARNNYAQAASDPNVAGKAAVELQQSREALSRAEDLSRNGADDNMVSHAAYLADQRVKIAQAAAAEQNAQSHMTSLKEQENQEMLDAHRQQTSMADLNARETERGLVMTLANNVLFDVGGSTLKPGAMPSINRLAGFLAQHPDRTITVEGFTDDTGASDTNQALSQQRAEAVKSALVGQGVDPNHIAAEGMGPSDPIASNDNPAGRQLNRRVEVVMSENQNQNQNQRADIR